VVVELIHRDGGVPEIKGFGAGGRSRRACCVKSDYLS
jgi:hypothetical protein